MRWIIGIVLATGLFSGVTAQSAKTTLDGVYTAAQAQRGEAAYTKNCVSCHGPDLMGLDTAPSLTGPEFTASWTDQSADDLQERIRVSMPADKPGSLSRTDVADIIAFLFAKDGFPAGSTELPAASDELKAIKILAQKK
jgi:mono/diheme cytochrome c family protein